MKFPVTKATPEKDYPPQRDSIPWEMIERYRQDAERRSGLTLEQFALQGGLSAAEIVALAEGKEIREVQKPGMQGVAEMIERLDDLVSDFERCREL